MGSCQNYGPVLGTLNNRCRIIIGTQNGTIILTTTQIYGVALYSGSGFGFSKQYKVSEALQPSPSTQRAQYPLIIRNIA